MSSNNKDQVNRIKGRKFSKYMKAPVKFLVKVRDFYIESMTKCSSVAGYGSAMGCPSGHLGSGLARSFSASSTESRTTSQDYRELLRLASLRNLSTKIESGLGGRQGRKSPATGPAGVRRSCSVGIGRIDEDKECEFGDDDVKVGTGLYSRSRSYAPILARRTRAF